MREYALIMLDMPENVWIYLNEQCYECQSSDCIWCIAVQVAEQLSR